MVLISIPGIVSGTTLAKCVDTSKTIMLEFQGVIELDGPTFAGNQLGQLSILNGGVKAQLIIGNHRLDGKVIKLDRPLLLIQKQTAVKDTQENDDMDMDTSRTAKDQHKNASQQSERDRRRSSFDMLSSPMPPSSPPRDDDTMDYSTVVAPPIKAADPMAPENVRDAIQYDTVAIIRQKIIFNTMPVPIIHTDRRGLTVIKRGV